MHLNEQNPMFPYTEDDKQTIWNELNLNETTLREGVDAVMDWFEKQPHLVEAGIDRIFIEKMIVISKGSLERTKSRIDSFYKYRSLAPELIQGREVLHDPQSKLWNVCSMIPIAKMQDGRRLHMMKFAPDLGSFDITDLFKNGFMYVDIRMRYDYWLGDIWILDFQNISLSHIFSLKPTVLRKAALLFQNGLNWRIHAIHILNLNYVTALVQGVLEFFKQFFSSLIMSRVTVHDTLDDLYKHVPKHCLPEDYGGSSPSTTVLTENLEKEFKRKETIDFLLEYSKLISNESRRPFEEYSVENLPGTFRQLEVD